MRILEQNKQVDEMKNRRQQNGQRAILMDDYKADKENRREDNVK